MSRHLRSYLFVPGNRTDRIEKARSSGADALIVDLEDAVSPEAKIAARNAVADALSPTQPVYLRINGPDTEWFKEDLRLCSQLGVKGVVLPKSETIDHVKEVAGCLSLDGVVLPLIETAAGFANINTIAASEHVDRLVFGTIDFQLDLGIDGEEDELLYFRSKLVLVSKIAGIQPPVDGVTVALDDPAQLRKETTRSRRIGFGGKLCIHPKQVQVVNECFAPSKEEMLWAQRVMEAASAAGGAAVAVDGKMVDKPVMLKAQAILERGTRAMSKD